MVLVWCLCGVCVVLVWCLCGVCVVFVWCLCVLTEKLMLSTLMEELFSSEVTLTSFITPSEGKGLI